VITLYTTSAGLFFVTPQVQSLLLTWQQCCSVLQKFIFIYLNHQCADSISGHKPYKRYLYAQTTSSQTAVTGKPIYGGKLKVTMAPISPKMVIVEREADIQIHTSALTHLAAHGARKPVFPWDRSAEYDEVRKFLICLKRVYEAVFDGHSFLLLQDWSWMAG
jgi:hypothetical protein